MSIGTSRARGWQRASLLSLSAGALLTSAACTKQDAPPSDSTTVLAPAPAPSAASSTAMTPVRGTIAAVSDTAITVTTATGAQQIRVVAPLHVYASAPSDLTHVTPNSFVGITSVTQPDGSQRATEIHVFPEELRGTGEGSRLMEGTGGSGGRSTMTNGTVSPSRMTNGTVNSTGGGTTFTVQYQGGTQTIAIPAGVTVTAIGPSKAPLAVGANVIVLASPGADGQLSATSVMLGGPPARK
jgi:hypothetical protein